MPRTNQLQERYSTYQQAYDEDLQSLLALPRKKFAAFCVVTALDDKLLLKTVRDDGLPSFHVPKFKLTAEGLEATRFIAGASIDKILGLGATAIEADSRLDFLERVSGEMPGSSHLTLPFALDLNSSSEETPSNSPTYSWYDLDAAEKMVKEVFEEPDPEPKRSGDVLDSLCAVRIYLEALE